MLAAMDPQTPQPVESDLLRLSTAGSVDDGKSTLIGRLLYETKSIFEDQLEAVERASREKNTEYVNLALLTDGLRAEREQGITIDVAYRYFSTPRRKFILADTPGHVQYTRNMVTGTSTADLTIVLVDARKGLTEQSRRHTFIASLLRVPHLVICINKMDLVDYAERVYEDLRAEFLPFLSRLDLRDVTFIPVSALHGDNVVQRSTNMPWFDGPPLLHHLENVFIASDRNLIDVRFPVQWIVRPMTNAHHDYRGYAGQVASGVLKAGDEVMVLPSGLTSHIASVDTYDGAVPEAIPPMSVTLRLTDDLDVSRGDIVCRPNNQPVVSQDVDATICWMSTKPLRTGGMYSVKHTTRSARAVVKELRYRVNINTLHRDESATTLELNDIGRVSLRTTTPLCFDPYRRNRTTGGLILIDEATNETVAAGIILG
ncbi:MAG TPA: GTP-binding protein [Chloroflexota bacterium]|jgi:bifunctional enzyme CysN/CysC|nr:GTP-binding protein [Chloroflexota bacterium]